MCNLPFKLCKLKNFLSYLHKTRAVKTNYIFCEKNTFNSFYLNDKCLEIKKKNWFGNTGTYDGN